MFPDEPLKPGLWRVKPGSWNHSVEDGHRQWGSRRDQRLQVFSRLKPVWRECQAWVQYGSWISGPVVRHQHFFAIVVVVVIGLFCFCSCCCCCSCCCFFFFFSGSFSPFCSVFQLHLLLDDFVSFCSKHRAFTCHCRTLVDRRIGMPAEMQSQRLSGLLLS